MGQPHDILGLIITVYNTPAQPIARREATLLYIFSPLGVTTHCGFVLTAL
jgi:hypothetical protein